MTIQEKEMWQEAALVDISYEVLNRANQTMSYREIFKEAARLKGLTDEELMELLPQVYTEMNLDGRFICISPGQWGLKKWYTTESIEESVEALARSKGIDDDDDYGFEDDEEVEDYIEDDEDYDDLDDEDIDEEDLDDEEVLDEEDALDDVDSYDSDEENPHFEEIEEDVDFPVEEDEDL